MAQVLQFPHSNTRILSPDSLFFILFQANSGYNKYSHIVHALERLGVEGWLQELSYLTLQQWELFLAVRHKPLIWIDGKYMLIPPIKMLWGWWILLL